METARGEDSERNDELLIGGLNVSWRKWFMGETEGWQCFLSWFSVALICKVSGQFDRRLLIARSLAHKLLPSYRRTLDGLILWTKNSITNATSATLNSDNKTRNQKPRWRIDSLTGPLIFSRYFTAASFSMMILAIPDSYSCEMIRSTALYM